MKLRKTKLILKSINYAYDVRDYFRFENLSISIYQNTITTLIGKNGSGKTTLLLLMLGYIKPTSGEIMLREEGDFISVNRTAGKMAYLPQNEIISLGFTVDDFLLLGRVPFINPFSQPSDKDYEIVERIKKELAIKQLENKKLDQISGGELQRVRIGRALVQESDILIFDEPITYLDIGAKEIIFDLMDKLKNNGKTIIFTSHDPLEAFQIADNTILLTRNEKVQMGATNEILSDDNLSHCLGTLVRYKTYAGQKFLFTGKEDENRDN